MRKWRWLCVAGVMAGLHAQSLDVPITVEETAGAARVAEPVTFGVPLPKGAVRDLARLRLFTPEGKPAPAAFRVVSRWWEDAAAQVQSIRWVHVDFFADVPAAGRSVYRLRTSEEAQPAPASPVKLTAEPDSIQINTGAATFTVKRSGPVLDGPGLRNLDFLLRSDERIYKASQWPRSELSVEDENPLRVVIKRTGSHGWVDRQDRALDYVLRIVAYSGKPYVRLIYSFVNRQGRGMEDFVRLDGLWMQADLEGETPPARVEQLAAEPHRPGWFEAGDIRVGLRWFWQL